MTDHHCRMVEEPPWRVDPRPPLDLRGRHLAEVRAWYTEEARAIFGPRVRRLRRGTNGGARV